MLGQGRQALLGRQRLQILRCSPGVLLLLLCATSWRSSSHLLCWQALTCVGAVTQFVICSLRALASKH